VAQEGAFLAKSAAFYIENKADIEAIRKDAKDLASIVRRECGTSKFNATVDNLKASAEKGAEIALDPQSKDATVNKSIRDVSGRILAVSSSGSTKVKVEKLSNRAVAIVGKFRENVIKGGSRPSPALLSMVKKEIDSTLESVKGANNEVGPKRS
jgi:hypothetical protein